MRVALDPTQIMASLLAMPEVSSAKAKIVGSGLTVTVRVAVAVQPFVLVAVTV